MALSAECRLDLSMVLTSARGDRFLVIDAIGDKLKLVWMPPDMTAQDFGTRFRHAPEAGNPTRCELVGVSD